jgi:hypothetical protein
VGSIAQVEQDGFSWLEYSNPVDTPTSEPYSLPVQAKVYAATGVQTSNAPVQVTGVVNITVGSAFADRVAEAILVDQRNRKLEDMANGIRRAKERYRRLNGRKLRVPNNLLTKMQGLSEIQYDDVRFAFTNGGLLHVLVIRGDTKFILDFRFASRKESQLSVHRDNKVVIRSGSLPELWKLIG